MNTRRMISPRFDLFVIGFLIIFGYGMMKPWSTYADPILPIVADQGDHLIDVFPLQHKLVVWKQGKKRRHIL